MTFDFMIYLFLNPISIVICLIIAHYLDFLDILIVALIISVAIGFLAPFYGLGLVTSTFWALFIYRIIEKTLIYINRKPL